MERIETELGSLDASEVGVLVDLFLTWRALSRWNRMIDLYGRLPAVVKRAVLIREQYGFALNRMSRRGDALAVLESVLSEQGPSSETLGLIGRIYKDQWMEALRQGETRLALGYLDRALDMYARGFEADWRDAYPGINAVTLLDIKGDNESLRRQGELLPVVRFAVKQRLTGTKPIYWDHATLLELSVLDNSEKDAFRCLSDALAGVREPWEAETTGNNLRLIRDARRTRGVTQEWLDEVIQALEQRGAASRAR